MLDENKQVIQTQDIEIFGDEYNRCNLCNTGKCPRGITTQDPKLYRRLDADKVAETGTPVVQINTGGGCHLDANMIELALNQPAP
jgi:Ni2+-binding GTPase involved in maturation of urease and hydrogenase